MFVLVYIRNCTFLGVPLYIQALKLPSMYQNQRKIVSFVIFLPYTVDIPLIIGLKLTISAQNSLLVNRNHNSHLFTR